MKKTVVKISAVLSGVSGIVILGATIWPILDYRLQNQNLDAFLVPLVEEDKNIEIDSVLDFTKASNWFEGGNGEKSFDDARISYYNISIPKLRIDGATVAIGGEDLSQSLIQYPGTALPGKKGNAAIFGHSILPIFYDPKNYMSIFSTLPTLTRGDEIVINYDGVTYTYKVEEKFEVLPTDIQVLQQDISDSFLTLVTCVPPGDPRKPKRLIIRARIVQTDLSYNSETK